MLLTEQIILIMLLFGLTMVTNVTVWTNNGEDCCCIVKLIAPQGCQRYSTF